MNFKRPIISFILLVTATLSSSCRKSPAPTLCPFCNPEILERQMCYEDSLLWVLYTHAPIVPAHFLIIPKRHIERFEQLTNEELTQIGKVTNKLQTAAHKALGVSAYLLHQKNGVEVGQQVPHIHIHMIGRAKGDGSMLSLIWNILMAQVRGPLPQEKLQKTIDAIKQEMQ